MSKFLSKEQLEKLAETFCEDIDVSEYPNESDEDLSDAPIEHSDHDSDSEFEIDSEEEGEPEGNIDEGANYFYGRNRYKWSKSPPAASRTRASNIVIHLPGLKGPAANAPPKSPLEAWSLLFSEDILNEILEHTNAKITDASVTYGPTASYVGHLDMTELKAFLGLLILTGAFKSNHEDIRSLFASDGTGRNICRAVMSEKRFLFLLAAIRFDDRATRQNRIESGDKLAAISKIYDIFNNNCKNNYTCSEYAVVDEMLVGFRGRCSFRQYIKSKPRKYGIKIMCLCDSKTHYMLNSFVYTGKTTSANPKKLSVPTRSVLKLVSPIINTNRNVTGDNWFTSIELISELKKVGLTYVGTLRKNKPEIPQVFLPSRQKLVNSCQFGFTHDNTLVSFTPKKNKCVVLVSSMHHNDNVAESGKPEIIEFYNETKGGVDALDQKCMNYTCQRRTRRWPMAIFGAMLDMSRVNSYVLLVAGLDNITKLNRRDFAISLGKELIKEHMIRRADVVQLPREIKLIIKNCLEVEPQPSEPGPVGGYRRCYLCERKKDRKIKTTCNQCHQHVCKDHSTSIIHCTTCFER